MKKVIVVLAYVAAVIFMVVFTLKSVNALDIPITIASAKVAEVSTGYKKQIDWPASQRMISILTTLRSLYQTRRMTLKYRSISIILHIRVRMNRR